VFGRDSIVLGLDCLGSELFDRFEGNFFCSEKGKQAPEFWLLEVVSRCPGYGLMNLFSLKKFLGFLKKLHGFRRVLNYSMEDIGC